MCDIEDNIWMVEVGTNGWSKLCESYHEAYAAAKERLAWLSMVQKRPVSERVLVCLNGVKYEEMVLAS